MYEFGQFSLDATERVLLRNGEPVGLTPKVFDTLLALIESSGHIVEKDVLMKRIWPDSFVEEGNLAFNISVLRKTLAEGANGQQFIETVPRRGYRFVANVVESRGEAADVILEKRTRSRLVIRQEREDETESLESSGAGEHHSKSEEAHALEQSDASRTARRRYSALTSAPLLALSLLVVGVIAAVIYSWTQRAPKLNSVAVLPFKPLTAGREEQLELGMADALITRLSNLKQITVRPTSAVVKYAEGQDPLAAGRELGVDAVLDGRIQRVGNQIRVTVQLVRISDGTPMWADKFDESFTNIFSVQDSISERMTAALMLKLSGEEKLALTKRYTDNTEAYQAYLKGRFYWSKWTTPALSKAIESFEQALEKDPDYALAYSGLADAYSQLGYFDALPTKEAYLKSEAAATRAIELDNTLSEAYLSLAKKRLFYDWDWSGAERDIKRAIELNPNHAESHNFYGAYLCAMGRFDETIAERKRAQELDPLSPFVNMSVGWSYYYARRYEQAAEWYEKALELDPNFDTARISLAECYEQAGMFDKAFEEHLKNKTLAGTGPEIIAAFKQAYAASGIKGYWQKELELTLDQMKQKSVRPINMVRIYVKVGDKDRAFEWLEKAYLERASVIVFANVLPTYDSLRSDPRFQNLVGRIGLPH